jgi:hypothetical protein
MKRALVAAIGAALSLGCASNDAPPAEDVGADASVIPSDGAADTAAAEAGRPADLDGPAQPWGDSEILAPPCNGNSAYCAMRFDQWCQAATEDSAANSSAFWQAPTQSKSILNQLQNGIRALLLRVQRSAGAVSVCRASCAQGSPPLATVLVAVKDFLGANPREVVTLVVEASVSTGELEAEFTAQKLDTVAYSQSAAAGWPTLGDMIASGKRLVVLANTTDGLDAGAVGDAGVEWILPRSTLLWETGSHWASLVEMNCSPAVGDESRPLFLVHNDVDFVPDGGGAAYPSPDLAAQANAFATVTARLQACKDQHGRAPNFVAVDFFDLGDAVGATQVLNGVRQASP